jgi:WhiB family transcriptional regulator, redox-sensing transcriptional regulator
MDEHRAHGAKVSEAQALPAPAWPATLEEFWSWHMEAACRQVDTTLFYSPEGERGPRKERREAAAKQVCGSCKVVELCAAYAIATREPYGTWGGLSEHDRRELVRRVDPRMALLRYRAALADWEQRERGVGLRPTATDSDRRFRRSTTAHPPRSSGGWPPSGSRPDRP